MGGCDRDGYRARRSGPTSRLVRRRAIESLSAKGRYRQHPVADGGRRALYPNVPS